MYYTESTIMERMILTTLHEYTKLFFAGLIFTVTLETIVLVFLVRKTFSIGVETIPSVRLIASGWFASFSTIPYVWYVFTFLMLGQPRPLVIAVSELFALFVETIFYAIFLPIGIRKAFIISFAANVVSFLLGLLLQGMGLVPSTF